MIMSKWGSKCASATLKPAITLMQWLPLHDHATSDRRFEKKKKNIWFLCQSLWRAKFKSMTNCMLCHFLLQHVKKPRQRIVCAHRDSIFKKIDPLSNGVNSFKESQPTCAPFSNSIMSEEDSIYRTSIHANFQGFTSKRVHTFMSEVTPKMHRTFVLIGVPYAHYIYPSSRSTSLFKE